MPNEFELNLSCPVPLAGSDFVQMAHGGGGRMMHRLLEQVVLPAFGGSSFKQRHDSAVVNLPNLETSRLAFTTDSYVVHPHFFPGGDIGSLAVNGTVNDLAMSGARPVWLSASFILEEGFPFEQLRRVLASMRRAADAAGVEIVTGDTKVVDRGKGDGIFINTAGIGLVEHFRTLGPAAVRPGDAVIVSGDIGRHGIAIMAAREGIDFETDLESDCAAIARPALKLLSAGLDVHCLRDLTRGGLASALVEIAEGAGLGCRIQDDSIPVHGPVRAACELLGLDPMYVACEGRFIAYLPRDQAAQALDLLHADPSCVGAAQIGTVESGPSQVILRSRIGTSRIIDMISGEQLPRIC